MFATCLSWFCHRSEMQCCSRDLCVFHPRCSTGLCYAWYPGQLRVQEACRDEELVSHGELCFLLCVRGHGSTDLRDASAFLHQHKSCPSDLAIYLFKREMTGLGQDTDYAMTLNGIKVLTSFLLRETAFGSIDPSDKFGRTRLSTFAAKTCGRGK